MVKKSIELQVALFIFFAGIFFGGIFLDVDLGYVFLNASFKAIKPYLLSLSFIFATPLAVLLILQIFGKSTKEEDTAYYIMLKRLFHLGTLVIFAMVLGLISTFLYLQLIKLNIGILSAIVSIGFFILVMLIVGHFCKRKFGIHFFNFMKH